jgi:hypothetical protein
MVQYTHCIVDKGHLVSIIDCLPWVKLRLRFLWGWCINSSNSSNLWGGYSTGNQMGQIVQHIQNLKWLTFISF